MEGMRVRLVGTSTKIGDEEFFETSEIEPFKGRGGLMMHQGPPPQPMPPQLFSPMKEN